MTENRPLELYFHIPFCVRKCFYCDFLSAPGSLEEQEAYMKALFLELCQRAKEYKKYQVSSIFIGGGTPSAVKVQYIEQLMDLVKEHFSLTKEAEITIEVNPGTADEEKLRHYWKAGINRISIGLQSAHNKELKKMGRIHTYEEFLNTYYSARKVGFANVNVDIMSALPEQTLSSYRQTLDKVLKLTPPPEHISAYSLIVEEGTPFYEMEQAGKLLLPDEETERQMYQETKKTLKEAGLERYEISNYAKKGYACRHNCGYWNRTNYAGFGIGAASLIENERFHNSSSIEAYLQNPLGCQEEKITLTRQEQMEEFMFLGLRMTEGISVSAFQKNFGVPLEEIYGSVLQKNIQNQLLKYTYRCETGEEMLCLTEKGLDISNYIMAQFLL